MSNDLVFSIVMQSGESHEVSLPAVGTAKRWNRRFGVMRSPDLAKHSLGVHLYTKLWSGGVIECAVRRSNGCVNPDGTGFCGRLYFSDLPIRAPAGSRIVGLEMFAPGAHEFVPRGILIDRFLLVPTTTTGDQEVALLRRILGFRWVDFVSRLGQPWGPAHEFLLDVNRDSLAIIYGDAVARMKTARAAGQALKIYGPQASSWILTWMSEAHGPWAMDGDPQAGQPAGYKIDVAFGWQQCAEALELASISHKLSMARNPVACYSIATGLPIRPMDWTSTQLSIPQLMEAEPGRQSYSELTAFCDGTYPNFKYREYKPGSCSYSAWLRSWFPDDPEHIIRATTDAAALVGWTGDPLAADDLLMLYRANQHRGFNDRPELNTDPKKGYVPASLTNTLHRLVENPGHGDPAMLRSFGHMMRLSAWTEDNVSLLSAFELALDKDSIPQREQHTPYLPTGWQGTQHFHTALDYIGAWDLANSIGYVEHMLAATRKWAERVLLNPAMPLRQNEYGPGTFGPPKWIGTMAPDGSEPALSTANTWGEGFSEHTMSVLGRAAQAAQALGDDALARWFLEAGLALDVPRATLFEKLAFLRTRTGDLSQISHYTAALEAMAL